MKYLLSDVDGILLNWKKGFQQFISEKFSIPCLFDCQINVEEWLGITQEEAMKLVHEFHMAGGLLNLEAFSDAVNVVPSLVRNGWTLVLITACGNTTEAYQMRKNNLENTFGSLFEELHTVNIHDSKYEHLSKYNKSVWVEDTLSHAIDGAECGHKTFLIDRHDQNIDVPSSIIRVKDWYGIREYLEQKC